MISVIVSHDVDHLSKKDHYLRDLFFQKLIVRSTIELAKNKISLSEWRYRCLKSIKGSLNNIDDLMSFDSDHNVPATYFFGMEKGLGMSYKPIEAKPYISKIIDHGFYAGVHGIAYENIINMRTERDRYSSMMGVFPSGMRTHYVRTNANTFRYASDVGYLYDSSDFNKTEGRTIKAPYKVNNLWEFPLTLMDSYLPYDFDEAKNISLNTIQEIKDKGIKYITVLHHDYMFCEAYEAYKQWYVWIINYFSDSSEYRFVSFEDAIRELEGV